MWLDICFLQQELTWNPGAFLLSPRKGNLTVGTEEKEIKTPSWATASAFAPNPGTSELLPTQEPGQVICLGSAQEVRELEQARDGVSYAA